MDLDRLSFRRFFERAVERNAAEPFLVWTGDDGEWTYEQANERIDRAARAWHELGVRPGDRVALMLDNSPEFLFAWLGLAKIGGVLVAINTALGPAEAAHLLADSGSRLALADDARIGVLERAAAEAPALERTLTVGGRAGADDFLALIDQADASAPAAEPRGDDLISLIYTSGTTGAPKGVMQTHRNFVLTGQAYPDWVRLRRGQRVYACLPLFHINSQAYATMGAIGAEGALVLAPRFSASRFWPEVRRHRVNAFNFIGAMTVILASKEPEPSDADNDVHVAYGVPALPPDVVAEVERRFGLRVLAGFGMSETTFGLLEPYDGERRPGTMGVPRHHPDPSVPRTEAAIIDDEGREAPDGTVGELVLRNAAMMRGYWRDPERTAEVLSTDGWLRTGDSAWRDADGHHYFVDRKKDIVRRRGENVSSLEVERVVDGHPAVLESAAVGVPSELTDEDLVVFAVPRTGARVTPGELVEWCAARLAAFKVPTAVRLVEELPKTPTAKVAKHRLRERARADRPGD